MRNELEIIQQIERYLDGELSPEDRAAFEKQLADDPELQEDVRLQRELMSGIDRAAWRDKVQQAGRRYVRKQRFWKGGTSGFVVLIAVLTLVWRPWVREGHPKQDMPPAAARVLDTAHRTDTAYNTDTTNPAGTAAAPGTVGLPWKITLPGVVDSAGARFALKNGQHDSTSTKADDVDKHLPPQTFRIDATRDTVIETKSGIVFAIPAGAFLLDDGHAAVGGIELVVREALDPASIIHAGLPTLSGGQLLESGGMFSVNASKDGKPLRIDPAHGVYAEIPTDSVKPGMQLYSGKRLAEGTIDWVNPQPLDHGLVAVDIQTLDFYPPRYIDSLRRWGYDSRNKAFTDSLYYSFARLFGPDEGKYEATDYGEEIPPAPMPPVSAGDSREVTDTTYTPRDTIARRPALPCNINPAKIKAIWNEQFQHTLLSTREFGERMPWIHRTESGAILDLYVNHLDQNLSDIDSMAIHLLGGRKNRSLRDKFRYFQERRDGKVKHGSSAFEKLRAYYQLKEKIFTEAAAATERAFRTEQAALDRDARRRELAHEADSFVRVDQNFKEEMAVNLAKICQQLGIDETIAARPAPRGIYRVRLSLTGWCNIDRAIAAATSDQVTTAITDAQTGQQAVINYSAVSIRVNKPEVYDRVCVYLLPDKLSSFIRLSGAGDKYEGKLDGYLIYSLVCIGYKKEQPFYHYESHIGPGDHLPVTLDSIGAADLDRRLNTVASATQSTNLQKENAWVRFEITDRARLKYVSKVNSLQCEIMRLLFPCFILNEGCWINE